VIIIKKGLGLYVGFVLSGLLILFNFYYHDVKAAAQTGIDEVLSNNPNKGGVDRTVPKGLTDISDWFNIPTIANNNSQILPAQSSTGGVNNKGNSDVIRLTSLSDTDKVGAVWSKRSQTDEDERNFINIKKRQTMSMWMFFGGAQKTGGAETGDGMAFVLQNVNDNAFTTTKNGSAAGETIGVWGSPFDPVDIVPSVLASRAIAKSWALEFDTYQNVYNSYNSAFDTNQSALNHIASGYPALASTYSNIGKTGLVLNHQNAITTMPTTDFSKNFLTDDRWHHVTLTWNPAAADSTMASVVLNYDDKNLDGTAKLDPSTGKINSKTMSVDTTNFDLNGNDKLYWGFTGSVGSTSENNLIVFESIPAIVEADVSSKIIDESAGDHVLSAPTSENKNANVVHDGDSVSVNYDLNYLSGSQPWADIIAKINLPEQVSYKNANITYTKKDGSTQTENIDELAGMTTNEITHTLAQSLYKDNIVSANIKFEGTVTSSDKTKDSSVASAHAGFYGDNLQKDVMTTAFVIKQPVKISLTKESDDPTINIDQETNLQGKVSYSDSSTVDPSKLELVVQVNDGDPMKVDMNTIATTGTFSLPVSKALFPDLKEGVNTVKIYVYNKDDFNASDPIYFDVTVIGSLQVKASQLSHFNSVQAMDNKQIISRSDDWSVDVEDSRDVGSEWYLFAEATPLTKGDDTWDGGLAYVNKNHEEKPLTDSKVNIDSGVKSEEGLQSTDIDKEWAANTGVLLRKNSYEEAGVYTSTITWTAQDSL